MGKVIDIFKNKEFQMILIRKPFCSMSTHGKLEVERSSFLSSFRKRLAMKASEIVVQFKRPPEILFGKDSKYSVSPNLLVIRSSLTRESPYLNSKTPGLETKLQPIELAFGYETTFGSNTPEAYERLILDALNGDGTLFIRGDEAETSWSLLTPVLDFWQEQGRNELESYTAGTWGQSVR